jgi:hypothetical protein
MSANAILMIDFAIAAEREEAAAPRIPIGSGNGYSSWSLYMLG